MFSGEVVFAREEVGQAVAEGLLFGAGHVQPEGIPLPEAEGHDGEGCRLEAVASSVADNGGLAFIAVEGRGDEAAWAQVDATRIRDGRMSCGHKSVQQGI